MATLGRPTSFNKNNTQSGTTAIEPCIEQWWLHPRPSSPSLSRPLALPKLPQSPHHGIITKTIAEKNLTKNAKTRQYKCNIDTLETGTRTHAELHHMRKTTIFTITEPKNAFATQKQESQQTRNMKTTQGSNLNLKLAKLNK